MTQRMSARGGGDVERIIMTEPPPGSSFKMWDRVRVGPITGRVSGWAAEHVESKMLYCEGGYVRVEVDGLFAARTDGWIYVITSEVRAQDERELAARMEEELGWTIQEGSLYVPLLSIWVDPRSIVLVEANQATPAPTTPAAPEEPTL